MAMAHKTRAARQPARGQKPRKRLNLQPIVNPEPVASVPAADTAGVSSNETIEYRFQDQPCTHYPSDAEICWSRSAWGARWARRQRGR